MQLTDTAIRRAKAKKKPYKVFDSGGLFLLIMPNGGKWWRFKYRFNIPLSFENPKIFRVYDTEVVSDGIAIDTPVSRHFVA